MIKVDWGAYLGGELPKAERAEIQRELEVDAALRQDYEAFLEYRAAMKRAAFAELVPEMRLEEALDAISKAKPPVPRLFVPMFAAAAVFLLISFLGFKALTHDPMAFATTPTAARIHTQSPEEASAWVRANTPFDAPVVRLGGLATLDGARYGEGWACYDFVVDGKQYYLYIRSSADQLEHGTLAQVGGATYYVGRGIGWKSLDLAYYLRGGDEQTRRKLADAAVPETTQTSRASLLPLAEDDAHA